MSAAERLATVHATDATELCRRAEAALASLVDVMNQETTALRAGRYKQAAQLTPLKAQLGQDYVTLARAVQHEGGRLAIEAPEALTHLQGLHGSFATQMAENLRVLATVRNVTEDLLSDVAKSVGAAEAPNTYQRPANGRSTDRAPAKGLTINRAL